jgi:type II secretory pathway predicted ATPase ExeA
MHTSVHELKSVHGIGYYTLRLLQSKLTSQNKQLEVLLASHSELRGELSSARRALKNRAQSSAKRYPCNTWSSNPCKMSNRKLYPQFTLDLLYCMRRCIRI